MANIDIFKNVRIGETRAIFDEIYKEIYGDERNGPWTCIVDNMRPIDLHALKYNEVCWQQSQNFVKSPRVISNEVGANFPKKTIKEK